MLDVVCLGQGWFCRFEITTLPNSFWMLLKYYPSITLWPKWEVSSKGLVARPDHFCRCLDLVPDGHSHMDNLSLSNLYMQSSPVARCFHNNGFRRKQNRILARKYDQRMQFNDWKYLSQITKKMSPHLSKDPQNIYFIYLRKSCFAAACMFSWTIAFTWERDKYGKH